MLGVWVRSNAFWMLDALKGGHVKDHYRDIESIIQKNDTYEILYGILNYAVNKTEYYRTLKWNTLIDFPIVNKNIIKNNSIAFRSSDYPSIDSLHVVYTGGSSGVPFMAVQDANKRNRTVADLINCQNSLGWHLGEKYVFIRGWSQNYQRSRLKNFCQNVIPIDSRSFDDDEINKLIRVIEKNKKLVIIGYASALAEFADYIIKHRIDTSHFSVKLVVSNSDMLSNHAKTALGDIFRCPIVNRYDNEEHGLLAHTNGHDDIFAVNTASYIVEILKIDKDVSADKGETGRIVVTDLFNRALPFIRYDTGDLAKSDDEDRHNIHTIYSLEGRVADSIYSAKGTPVSAATICGTLETLYNIHKYQLIQTNTNEYTLKVVCDADEYSAEMLSERLKDCLCEDAEISVEYLSDIPKEANGKYKTIKSLVYR
jgi:phenylacetate-CoA ligase